MASMELTAGLAGMVSHGSVALCDTRSLLAVCEQQRVTRVRGAGCNATGVPDEALDTLLERLGHELRNVTRYAAAENGRPAIDGMPVEVLDHHMAHACASYLSSPFTSATVIVCDHDQPKVSVWRAHGGELTRLEWRWEGAGFTDLYAASAAVLGFTGGGTRDHRMEVLARLRPDSRDARVDALFSGDGHSLHAAPGWLATLESIVASAAPRKDMAARAGVAAAVQARLGELFLDLLRLMREHTDDDRLCLGGTLFYQSSLNTIAKRSGLFESVFVPVDPGDPGLAVGTALFANRCEPRFVTPFLGPRYAASEVKRTLDNCKLHYNWVTDEQAIDAAVSALRKGLLVAWFEGAMEWGPRALGARSILADPCSPYVLDNLNGFLKLREPWRGYSLSVLEDSVAAGFDGPAASPFMECDYRVRDVERFRHVLPAPGAAIRVHTLGADASPRFARLVKAFGCATGFPGVVNTSFNGFHEPIVCSPRDAVRVFYGSGIDMLVLDQFILTK
jgi:carbamoyltransferase